MEVRNKAINHIIWGRGVSIVMCLVPNKGYILGTKDLSSGSTEGKPGILLSDYPLIFSKLEEPPLEKLCN